MPAKGLTVHISQTSTTWLKGQILIFSSQVISLELSMLTLNTKSVLYICQALVLVFE